MHTYTAAVQAPQYYNLFHPCVGFRRPLHLYMKSISPTVQVISLFIDRSGAVAGEDLDTAKCKRLKSHIGGVSKTFALDTTRHIVKESNKTDTCKAD